eukprot:Opistho-2@48963
MRAFGAIGAGVLVLCMVAALAGGVNADANNACDATWGAGFGDWERAFGAWKNDVCAVCAGVDLIGGECTGRSAFVEPSEGQKTSIFDHLTPAELLSVRAFVLDSARSGLNVEAEPTILRSNRINLIELELPKKKEAVAYLDTATARRPERRAKVVLYMGAESEPFVGFYSVGPIVDGVVAAEASAVLVSRAEWNQRSPDSIEYAGIEEVIVAEMHKLAPLTLYTYDAVYDSADCPSDVTANNGSCLGLQWTDTGPRGSDLTQRSTWLFFMLDGEGFYLMAAGLEFFVEHTSMDTADYSLKKVFFRGRSFPSTEALLAEWNADATYRAKLDFDLARDPKWSSLRRRGNGRAFEDLKAPKQQQLDGARYTISGQTVDWMDWRIHVGNNFEAGVRLMDVSFKGERIAYEMSFTEAAASYASGFSPSQGNTFYLDSAWGLGSAMYELLPGLDCPEHASFLDLYFVEEGTLVRRRHAVCIFEEDLAKPSIKHFDNDFDGSYVFVGGVRATRLVIRMSVSVYNYDYNVNWFFEYDGSINFQNSASGYMQAGFWSDDERNYGTRIQNQVMGQLHDHFIGLKLDLDIFGGTDNSFEVTRVKTEMREIPHLDQTREQKVFDRSYLKSEDESRIKMSLDAPAKFTFVNPSKRNKWGEIPGYKIIPETMARSILSAENPLVRGCSWIRDNIGVTVHKDSEPRNSHGYNQAVLAVPYLSYDSFFDGEDLEHADLVAWVTLGTFHFPASEDVPNSLLSSGNMILSIKPANYFDESPVAESQNSILLNPGTVVYDGISGKACAVKPVPIDYDGTTAVTE